MIIHFGTSASRAATCQVITIRKAKAIQMTAAISARRDCTIGQIRLAPPVPHQAAKMNINCQAKGLKYQVEPAG